ncbi:U32 family peptidase [Candidatus Woesearchaeota archaeon]|nr:U32 family peptidase [Candidatus Woesearchaeota archaeon]
MTHKLELNAPAGDMDCLKAAIANGADSVYLGMRLFNARRLTKNFTRDELTEAVIFAHLHGVKIYLTMNTLVRNDELQRWFTSLEEAYLAGIDAVIIQEVFLAPYIRASFPGLRIHASTQASIMNARAANLFAIDLVVLARELTQGEIKRIRHSTTKELEVFVHGHLCISYSGQCLISSLIGKRSGNRGICASSCRKRYNDQGYLISPKDLMLGNQIDKIYDLGINAVKIEGRMKTKEYVGITTQTYRKQIDTVHHLRPLSRQDIDLLRMGFNRDFTNGFLGGEQSIVGKEMPMNRGIALGTVNNGEMRLEHDLSRGDGISFWNKGARKLEGFTLHRMMVGGLEVEKARTGETISIPSRHFQEGAQVFLTSKALHSAEPKPKILNINVLGKKDQPLVISWDHGRVASEVPLQEAKTDALDQQQVELKLSHSARWGVQWQISAWSVDSGLFLPHSMIVKMRKALEEQLKNTVIPSRKADVRLPKIEEGKPSCNPQLLVKVYTIDQLKEADQAGVSAIYYDIFSNDVGTAKVLCQRAKFFLDTPVVMTDADIDAAEEIIQRIKPDGIVIGNWGMLAVPFAGEKHGKYSLNMMNDISMQELQKFGVIPTISVEINAQQAMACKNKNYIYYAHGQIPVMHFKGSYEERSLTDEKGYTFPLRQVNGNTEMLYSRPIATFESILPLIDAGVKYFLLDLNRNTTTIIKAYQKIINHVPQDISMLKKGTTLGNYNKGVA